MFELSELLFDLCDIGLEGRLLLDLGLLVCVDFLFGNEVVERLSWVLTDNRVGFRRGILENETSQSARPTRTHSSRATHLRLTSFFVVLRRFLEEACSQDTVAPDCQREQTDSCTTT